MPHSHSCVLAPELAVPDFVLAERLPTPALFLLLALVVELVCRRYRAGTLAYASIFGILIGSAFAILVNFVRYRLWLLWGTPEPSATGHRSLGHKQQFRLIEVFQCRNIVSGDLFRFASRGERQRARQSIEKALLRGSTGDDSDRTLVEDDLVDMSLELPQPPPQPVDEQQFLTAIQQQPERTPELTQLAFAASPTSPQLPTSSKRNSTSLFMENYTTARPVAFSDSDSSPDTPASAVFGPGLVDESSDRPQNRLSWQILSRLFPQKEEPEPPSFEGLRPFNLVENTG